jgi:hypothetical protein
MVKIAVGGSKMTLLIQGENFQNVFTQASCERTWGADICGTAVVLNLWGGLRHRSTVDAEPLEPLGTVFTVNALKALAGTHRANE